MSFGSNQNQNHQAQSDHHQVQSDHYHQNYLYEKPYHQYAYSIQKQHDQLASNSKYNYCYEPNQIAQNKNQFNGPSNNQIIGPSNQQLIALLNYGPKNSQANVTGQSVGCSGQPTSQLLLHQQHVSSHEQEQDHEYVLLIIDGDVDKNKDDKESDAFINQDHNSNNTLKLNEEEVDKIIQKLDHQDANQTDKEINTQDHIQIDVQNNVVQQNHPQEIDIQQNDIQANNFEENQIEQNVEEAECMFDKLPFGLNQLNNNKDIYFYSKDTTQTDVLSKDGFGKYCHLSNNNDNQLTDRIGDGQKIYKFENNQLNDTISLTDNKPNGFQLGWEPIEILSIDKTHDNKLFIAIKWKNGFRTLVPNYVANQYIPEMVIQFYEKEFLY